MDLTTVLQILPALLGNTLPVLADALHLLMAVPLVVRLVLVLWLAWVMYLAYTSLERAHKLGKVGRVATVLALPLLLVFWPLDVLINLTLLTLVFAEWPRELTITQRLGRHHATSTGWRHALARWLGAELLDPFDADGHHITPDPRSTTHA
jgi:hypothetical protein